MTRLGKQPAAGRQMKSHSSALFVSIGSDAGNGTLEKKGRKLDIMSCPFTDAAIGNLGLPRSMKMMVIAEQIQRLKEIMRTLNTSEFGQTSAVHAFMKSKGRCQAVGNALEHRSAPHVTSLRVADKAGDASISRPSNYSCNRIQSLVGKFSASFEAKTKAWNPLRVRRGPELFGAP